MIIQKPLGGSKFVLTKEDKKICEDFLAQFSVEEYKEMEKFYLDQKGQAPEFISGVSLLILSKQNKNKSSRQFFVLYVQSPYNAFSMQYLFL